MNNATLYLKNNSMQRADAKYFINTYLKQVKWRNNAKILDIGCGDGGVTCELLLPSLPIDFNKLVGIDISQNMVSHARNTWQTAKTDFIVMDIATKTPPKNLFENFDHIFSIYCLHWVSDQRQCFKNIFELLKPGGNLLLLFLINTPAFYAVEKLGEMKKWAPYMPNYQKYISAYHNVKDPVNVMSNLLEDVGFTDFFCKIETRDYTYLTLRDMKNSMVAIDPFIENVPNNQVTAYIEDYIEECLKHKTLQIVCNNNAKNYVLNNRLFIVSAYKP